MQGKSTIGFHGYPFSADRRSSSNYAPQDKPQGNDGDGQKGKVNVFHRSILSESERIPAFLPASQHGATGHDELHR